MGQLKLSWRRALVVFALIINTPQTAIAGPFEDAVAAYERKDYAMARALMVPLAEQGYSDAQRELAHWYMTGWAFATDDAQAFKWYQRAAAQGDANAMNQLGWFYGDGYGGVTPNQVQAYFWFALSATHTSNPASSSPMMRDSVGRGLTAAQIAEAMKLVHQWKAKAEKPSPRP